MLGYRGGRGMEILPRFGLQSSSKAKFCWVWPSHVFRRLAQFVLVGCGSTILFQPAHGSAKNMFAITQRRQG